MTDAEINKRQVEVLESIAQEHTDWNKYAAVRATSAIHEKIEQQQDRIEVLRAALEQIRETVQDSHPLARQHIHELADSALKRVEDSDG